MDGRKKSTLGYRWVQASYEVLELASPVDAEEACRVVQKAASSFRHMYRGGSAAGGGKGPGNSDETALVATGDSSSGSSSASGGGGPLWTQGGEVADAFVQALIDAALDALPPVIGRQALQQANEEMAAPGSSGASGAFGSLLSSSSSAQGGSGLNAPLPPLSLFADPTNGRSLGVSTSASSSGAGAASKSGNSGSASAVATAAGKGRGPKGGGESSAKLTGGSGLLTAGTAVKEREMESARGYLTCM